MKILDVMRYYKKNENENNMIRFFATMKDPVDSECLQYAADMAVKRHRLMRLTVLKDEQRLYLNENVERLKIHKDNGERHVVCGSDNRYHMTWVGYNDRDVILEMFHGITDGMGMKRIMQTILYYYCDKRYGGLNADKISGLITVETPEDSNEYMESLCFLPEAIDIQKKTAKYPKAFQLPEKQMESPIECQCYELQIDAKAYESYVKSRGGSPTSGFAAFMNRVIAKQQDESNSFTETLPVIGAMAVNARSAYGAEPTLQCCVGTVPMWYDHEIRHLPWEEQIKASKQMMKDGLASETLLAAAISRRRLGKMLEEKYPALKEKQDFCEAAAQKGLDAYTYGISCLGEMSYGESIDQFVIKTAVMLCANTSPIIIEITKYKDTYYMNYSTHLESDPYIWELKKLFEAEGISCTCKKQNNFIETLAVF